MSGSGISWDICKSAPHPRQITTPASHHSSFFTGRMRPSCHSTNSVGALKVLQTDRPIDSLTSLLPSSRTWSVSPSSSRYNYYAGRVHGPHQSTNTAMVRFGRSIRGPIHLLSLLLEIRSNDRKRRRCGLLLPLL